MSRLRYLNPIRIRDIAREIREIVSGGGPSRVRLVRVHEPRGLIVPTAELDLEVDARDGSVHEFTTAVPVPWPAAWSYRLARALGVPFVSEVDHSKRVGLQVPVPRIPGPS
ncbi:MAG: hypothetical protein ACR2G3_10565 [Solirubrobacterales bacterium]